MSIFNFNSFTLHLTSNDQTVFDYTQSLLHII